ncbi:MAG: transglutaminase-like domain-containing protein [Thermoleophilia bacterium]
MVRDPEPRLDHLALALAAEFRPVDAEAALAALDALGRTLTLERARGPVEEADACRRLLGEHEGFIGNEEDYDHPDNSMLDLVLARRTGLPILLSIVYAEVGRRAGYRLAGVGLPGHFVVGHFGVDPPLLLDAFRGGIAFDASDLNLSLVRPWTAHETGVRMLNNLVGAYERRGDVGRAIRAAELRLRFPLDRSLRDELELDLRRVRRG